ncbi:serine/threonine-protein phosphatase 6 regulatory ankyrin repeat subunit B-like [Patella vulgata]|uniref:serine/threonine-protein phosphatase 6 regulatory ankyrin repeat subunit B-like n=1 Tax=Patella vulgata TaxID=6465 RepID=UPI0024A8A21A|nr:serine/threonine-protein phosphatase 6 regulatory ankyrin repeat subunit B-like [Patella vulgata]
MESQRGQQTTTAEILIKAGCDVNIADKNGVTPLMKYVEMGNLVLVKELIDHGASVNAKDNKGLTHGMDINQLNSWNETPLYLATIYSNEQMVKSLIKSHCDVNITPVLLESIRRRETTIAEILINAAGCDVNIADKNGVTPLLESVRGEQTTIAEILIKAGCDVNSTDKDGATPLLR